MSNNGFGFSSSSRGNDDTTAAANRAVAGLFRGFGTSKEPEPTYRPPAVPYSAPANHTTYSNTSGTNQSMSSYSTPMSTTMTPSYPSSGGDPFSNMPSYPPSGGDPFGGNNSHNSQYNNTQYNNSYAPSYPDQSYSQPASMSNSSFPAPSSGSGMPPPSNGMFLGLDQSHTGSSTRTSFPSQAAAPAAASQSPYDPFADLSTSSSSNGAPALAQPTMNHTMNNYAAPPPQPMTSGMDSGYPNAPTSLSYNMDEKKDVDDETEEEEDDDKELRQAQEAALYAEELLGQQAEEKRQKQARGPLGLGLLPKAQEVIKQSTAAAPSLQIPTIRMSSNTDGGNSRVQAEDNDPSADDMTRSSELPPWYSSDPGARATSDFGLGGSSSLAQSQQEQQQPSSQPGKSASVMGASVLGGVAGLMVLGPLAGVVAAGGVAYASTKDGTMGNVMRGAGSLVARAGSAAKSFDEKNHVVAKTASGVAKGISWVAKASSSNP